MYSAFERWLLSMSIESLFLKRIIIINSNAVSILFCRSSISSSVSALWFILQFEVILNTYSTSGTHFQIYWYTDTLIINIHDMSYIVILLNKNKPALWDHDNDLVLYILNQNNVIIYHLLTLTKKRYSKFFLEVNISKSNYFY